jgi:hypothetical protein
MYSELDGVGPTTVACGGSVTKLARMDPATVVATKALTTESYMPMVLKEIYSPIVNGS